MYGKVPDQRLPETGVAEGDIFQFHFAGKLLVAFSFLLRGGGKNRIKGILQNILYALHLCVHHLKTLSYGDDRLCRRHEGSQEPLEHQDCTK